MGLTAEQLNAGLDAVAAREPALASALERAGYPAPRIRETGYRTLLRTIVGQQVSVAAAASVWKKLEALLGAEMTPEALLASEFDAARLRAVAAEAGLCPLALRAGGQRRT